MRLTLIFLLFVSQAAADESNGAKLFAHHCATCHGVTAEGDGPMAPVLTLQPVDLTALAAGNQGKFPKWRVIQRIDGRDPLLAHGSPMPVYGPFFEGRSVAIMLNSGQRVLTSQPIIDLMEWLESNQK